MSHRKVLIAICTMDRNESLGKLLNDLLRQDSIPNLPQVVIVDNSKASGARDFLTIFSSRHELKLKYLHEPRAGVSFARNKAMDLAAEEKSDLIFIDDDERAHPLWLLNLLNTSAKFPGSVICGPVVPQPNQDDAIWCPNHLCWQRPIYEDEALIASPVGTGNILIPFEAISVLKGFSHNLNSGGEDTEFTNRWLKIGGQIRYSRNAGTYEPVSATRTTPSYIRLKTSKATFIWAGLHPKTFVGKLSLLTRLLKYLVEGVWNSVSNSHRGNWAVHQKIYFAKLCGLIRYVFSLDFLRMY